MLIGVPKEIKSQENRVALVPAGVREFVSRGHKVVVEAGAGLGSGFSDDQYKAAGAEVEPDVKKIWAASDMIMKVKEPITPEYSMVREGQIVFTYFHFASSEELTHAMVKSKCIAIAYETVEKTDRSLPLLIPMSEVAGRMAVQQGAKYLEKAQGGRGILLGGIPGVRPANVMILGGGIVGTNAAKMAAGIGATVYILDTNVARLRYLDDILPKNVTTVKSNEYIIREYLPHMDLVVGAVLIPGAKAPRLITRDMLKSMKKGSVMVDVAIDQGGCFETSHATTHADPIYVVDDVIHYCVANMPGAVPYTSTLGLTNVTLPYALEIASKGWKNACSQNRELLLGLNMAFGKITYADVAEAWGLEAVNPNSVF